MAYKDSLSTAPLKRSFPRCQSFRIHDRHRGNQKGVVRNTFANDCKRVACVFHQKQSIPTIPTPYPSRAEDCLLPEISSKVLPYNVHTLALL
jgi:hypothetical protein